ncbi:DUF6759 domain-containing protein [Chryseobacterium sp. NRRL B-14859]|uniref:DUF6759 domain-containing protein n=1 Tax=unclassified Chryseobacterium TaxID=2593645 RepID=UPI000F45CE25|nr:DUF6759 domain-containing protein [Chryseobacterium sp. G0240]ROI00977.1 competence protein ComL [Chryseobacterium sp. G0240]
MKKLLVFAGASFLLTGCSVNYGGYPIRNPYPTRNSGNSSANVEREYNELMKTYKPETTDVLNDLLNEDPSSPKTSISIENQSRCNMVLTISGNNFFKKIPITAGKMGYTMLPRNQNYRLSGMVCNSSYQSTKFITSSYSIKLSN